MNTMERFVRDGDAARFFSANNAVRYVLPVL